GFGPLSRLDKADRDLLRKMVEQFEVKWRRRIGSDGSGGADSNGYGSGFEGLKLLDGLEFLIAVGILYYDLQALLLDMAKRKEMNSKEKRGISVLHVSGYPPVPLCSVCLDLFTELGSHTVQVATPHVIAPLRPR
ncbi:MAG: hypothetical protein OK404_03720, partial [Thaumarchaeota archaeon]|nr:hypothetical protein [Nitrososphaerota archaeon]